MLSIGTISTFQIIKYFQASNTKAIVIPVHQPTNYINPENKSITMARYTPYLYEYQSK